MRVMLTLMFVIMTRNLLIETRDVQEIDVEDDWRKRRHLWSTRRLSLIHISEPTRPY